MTQTLEAADPAARPHHIGVIPNLMVSPCDEAIAFYERAFGAKVLNRLSPEGEPGVVMHACLEMNGGHFFVNDAFPQHGYPMQTPQAFVMHLQVEYPQAAFDRALAAGAEVAMPMSVQFWGDRYGQVRDPYGVTWSIGGPA